MRKAGIAAEVVVNFVLPWVCYRIALQSMGETGALIFSAAPPMTWSLLVIVWFKRVDAVSLVIVAGILLSLFAMTLGRESSSSSSTRIVGYRSGRACAPCLNAIPEATHVLSC